ncbi:MAG: DinB family protein [Bryobacteraceae bacterium]
MEPWLSGRFSQLAPVPRLLCCSLEQSLADVHRWTGPLSDEQVWAQPVDKGSVGFQLRHLAGSVDRLIAYAKGEALSSEQLAFLRSEAEPGASKEELLAALAAAYAEATEFAHLATDFDEPRYIGRQRLETPLGVLLAHIAEHTQRHTGQLIVLSKFAYGSHR